MTWSAAYAHRGGGGYSIPRQFLLESRRQAAKVRQGSVRRWERWNERLDRHYSGGPDLAVWSEVMAVFARMGGEIIGSGQLV